MNETVLAQQDEERILLVDDEEHFLHSASLALRAAGYALVDTCSDSRQALQRIRDSKYDLVILDMVMPDVTGLGILESLERDGPEVSVCMMTALSDVPTVVRCMQQGALDYLVKPISKEQLVTSVRKALEHRNLKREAHTLKQSLLHGGLCHPEAFSSIITNHAGMRKVFQYAEAIAASPLPVLITGETGVGKEAMARLLHQLSGRRGPFVAVDAAGIDDHVFCDTLFGHVRGAFTGADQHRKGLLEEAADGTILLDEIGDLRPESQVKLLRLLQEGTFRAVGADRESRSKARIITATNRDLRAMMSGSSFRSDLYYRLQPHEIRIPALRERPEDLPLLARAFVEEACTNFGRPLPRLPDETASVLASYTWPGNVRELKGLIFDLVGRSTGTTLSLAPLRERLRELRGNIDATSGPRSSSMSGDKTVAFSAVLPTARELEDMLIQEALQRTGGNRSQAADLLGLTRQTVIRRTHQWRSGPAVSGTPPSKNRTP